MAIRRLAILGWDERLQALLAPLEARAELRLVGVGDRRGTALVRARSTTGAPCFQHPAEMLRRLEHDIVLIANAEAGADLAASAAARGTALLAVGDALPADALDAIATAAVRHRVPLGLIRPLLRDTAAEEAAALVAAAEPPGLLALELQDGRTPEAILRDAVALAIRLVPEAPRDVTAAAAGRGAEAILAQLRDAGRTLVTLTAASGARALRLQSRGEGAAFDIDARDGRVEIAEHAPEGATTLRRIHAGEGDAAGREADHVARALKGDASDLRVAHREAALLGAIESALATGQTHRIADPGTRATLQVLEGGAREATPRAGRLHIVPAEHAS